MQFGVSGAFETWNVFGAEIVFKYRLCYEDDCTKVISLDLGEEEKGRWWFEVNKYHNLEPYVFRTSSIISLRYSSDSPAICPAC